MSDLVIRPFSESEAQTVASWKYEPPFDIYDSDPGDAPMYLELSPEGYGYYAIVDADKGDELVGFCCFGPEGRVSGQADEQGTLDVGGGIRPDLVSRGIATSVFPAILEFAARFSPRQFRTAVASFNERSTRLCRSAGFEVVRTFPGPGGEFQELVRPAADP